MAGQAIVDRELTLDDFDYELPAELIAQHPLPVRDASRLLHLTATGLADRHFADMRATVRTRRSAGVQRHSRDQGAAAGSQAERRPGRGAGRAHRRADAGDWRWSAPATGLRSVRASSSTKPYRQRSRTDAATASYCASIPTCGRRSSGTATCRCRPTSTHADTPSRTPSATRPSTRSARRRGRAHRRPAFRLARCSTGCATRGRDSPSVTLHVGAGTFQPVRVRAIAGSPHACRVATR